MSPKANAVSVVREPDLATTLVKGLSVLEVFSPAEPLLGNSEIALRTGLTRPTAARLTRTLASLGYLRYDSDRAKYRLGAGVLSLANPLLAEIRVHQIARPLMQELAVSLKANISMGLMNGLDAVYIECVRVAETEAFSAEIGARLPLSRSAIGFALISMLAPSEQTSLVAKLLSQRADAKAAVKSALAHVQEKGFAISRGDWAPPVHAVAVPLMREPTTGAYLAINCGVPSFRLRPGELENEMGPRLAALAASIRALCARYS
ncbi:transcriptional regulator of IclR family [alpha proteobacterium U9-1i]|nr:transcriptional regulator of IclR family [alpha proteobacterium U9-1i]